jgi:hypothetical protein
VRFKRLQRVLVVGGDEHDNRQVLGRHLLDHFEAVEDRHLHVEKHQIGLKGEEHLDGVGAVRGFADHLDIRLVLQAQPDGVPRQHFVVDDDGFNWQRHGDHSDR